MTLVKVEKLWDICVAILEKAGVPTDDAAIIADSIVYAHIRGKHTHGISRMPIYLRKISENLLNKNTPLELIKDAGVISILDANNGFGQVAAIKAMDLSIEKAKKFGVGLVGVKDSNNFGTAGFIGEYATKAGMIGIIMANSGPAIAPIGANKAVFGTNPICVSYPATKKHNPIIFDMACSNAARGKIRLAAKNGEKIPFGWALDEKGKETDDPSEALKGTMVPIGEHKGYGIAMCVDILAGMMTGSAFAGEVKNLNHPTEVSRYGHLILAINPDFFLSKEEYEEKMAFFHKNVKASALPGMVIIPGERSLARAEKNKDIVEIRQNLISELNELAKSLGINEELKNEAK